MVVGSVLWLVGSQFLQRDTELAPKRVTDAAGGFPVVKSE